MKITRTFGFFKKLKFVFVSFLDIYLHFWFFKILRNLKKKFSEPVISRTMFLPDRVSRMRWLPDQFSACIGLRRTRSPPHLIAAGPGMLRSRFLPDPISKFENISEFLTIFKTFKKLNKLYIDEIFEIFNLEYFKTFTFVSF